MRILLILLGIYQAANGAFMLAAPDVWYATVPGVTETGPANIHFIRDIGLAFLAAAASLFVSARQDAGPASLLPAAIFLGGHALLHLGEMPLHGASGPAVVRLADLPDHARAVMVAVDDAYQGYGRRRLLDLGLTTSMDEADAALKAAFEEVFGPVAEARPPV